MTGVEKLLRIERDLAIALGSTSSLTDALDHVLEAALQVEGIDGGGVYLVDEVAREVHVVCHKGLSQRFVDAMHRFQAGSAQYDIVMAGQLYYKTFSDLTRSSDPAILHEGLRALAVIPVRFEGEVVAVLNLASREHDEIPVGSRSVLEATAAQIGGVVARVRAETALHQSEEKYRNLVEYAHDGICVVEGGVVRYLNERLSEIVGCPEEEILGKPFADFIHPDELGRVAEAYRRHIEEGITHHSYETALRHKDGHRLEIDVSMSFTRIQGGESVHAVIRDVTDRKRAEQALAVSERRYRSAVEDMPAMICRFLPDSTLTFVNDAYCRYFRKKREELVGRRFLKFIPEADRARVQETYGLLTPQQPMTTYEHHVTAPDGTIRWHRWTDRALFDEKGLVTEYQSVGEDITEHKRAKEVLSETNRLLEVILTSTHMLIAYLDPQFNFIRANEAYAAADERDPSFFPGKNHFDLYPDRENEAIFRRVVETGEPFYISGKPFTYPERPERGVTYWDWGLVPTKDVEGRVTGLVFTLANVTELKRAEEELRREKDKAQKYLDIAGSIILALDARGNITLLNEEGSNILECDREEVIGRNWFDTFLPEEIRESVKEVFGRLMAGDVEPVAYFENAVVTARGNKKIIRWHNSIVRDETGKLTGILSSGEDITDRKRAEEALRRSEEQLWHSQKMEAVGELAGRVAHDFSNFLTAVNGHIEFVMMKLGPEHELHGDVELIRQATGRAAELTRKLLQLSDRHHIEVRPIDINAEIEDLTLMLRHLVHGRVVIEAGLAPDVWTVLADAGSVHQVIMNLAVNASNAMPDGGTFSIVTKNVVVDETYCTSRPEARPGEFVCVTVSDTGCGMDPATLRRIFEPFFTTRERGEGTGLGLSTVYGIVRQHHGWVTVRSTVGVGTTFDIYLPGLPGEPVALEPEELPVRDVRGQGKHLLVVEDEPDVRATAARALREHGYLVDEATDAEEALRCFEEKEGKYDLVLTDVILPGQSGAQLAEVLLSRKPDLRIVLTSTWSRSARAVRHLTDRGIPFVEKPYKITQVLEVLREQLI